MKPAAVFLGLACVVAAQGALGATVPAKRSGAAKKVVMVKKPVPAKKKLPVPLPAKKAQAAPLPVQAVPESSYDQRELIKMPSPARLALRAEMRDRMAALDSVLQRMRDGQVVEAGQIAQIRLGVALWGQHSRLPKAAQPEQYMPQEMQNLALDGYKSASDFATVALTGDQHTATAMLSQLTGSCTQCHQAYRIR